MSLKKKRSKQDIPQNREYGGWQARAEGRELWSVFVLKNPRTLLSALNEETVATVNGI